MIKMLGIRAGKGGRLPGAEQGPNDLRRRGLLGKLIRAGRQVEDLGDIPGVYETSFASGRRQNVNYLPNILQVNRHTHACVLGTRRKAPAAFLLVIGGDHSLAIGTLAGLSDACERLGLIWIDAHADFNTPASSPSGNIHGMSLAVACGRGHRELRMIADLDPMVAEEDIALFGCRDLDEGEVAGLRSSRVRALDMSAWRSAGLTSSMLAAVAELRDHCDHVHLSFDIDVLDPQFVPGTGTPVPGGLTVEEARGLLSALAEQGSIASAEFVEYNPKLDPSGATGENTLSLILSLLAQM